MHATLQCTKMILLWRDFNKEIQVIALKIFGFLPNFLFTASKTLCLQNGSEWIRLLKVAEKYHKKGTKIPITVFTRKQWSRSVVSSFTADYSNERFSKDLSSDKTIALFLQRGFQAFLPQIAFLRGQYPFKIFFYIQIILFEALPSVICGVVNIDELWDIPS